MGIESSCDETAVALLKGERAVLSNVISSSARLHQKYGGIVPEVASRAHVQAINPAIAEALNRAESTLWDLSAVAVTIGPGLVGSLVVGVAAAKSLAAVLDIPLIGVNHLEAHIYSNCLENADFAPPAVGLIVSGGHTLLVYMPNHGLYDLTGQTLDDAAGEAFDKIARFLGLGFPGGPEIEQTALDGDPGAIAFPRAMAGKGFDFSFSGLKTSVINYVRKQQAGGQSLKIEDVCASFQEAVVDVLVDKTIKAAEHHAITNVFVCGGVAANGRLKYAMAAACEIAGMKLFYPSPAYCTDNAAMVACCGYHRFKRGVRTALDVSADPNLPLA
ncbi:MAG: tRNA (adenosine(37)-N6)-threonylcarbamoyltransferase complex transferase subunit TsaD [Actinomycetota bacterium]